MHVNIVSCTMKSPEKHLKIYKQTNFTEKNYLAGNSDISIFKVQLTLQTIQSCRFV